MAAIKSSTGNASKFLVLLPWVIFLTVDDLPQSSFTEDDSSDSSMEIKVLDSGTFLKVRSRYYHIRGLCDELYRNRSDESVPLLNTVLEGMNINSLVCTNLMPLTEPSVKHLAEHHPVVITPHVCKTRTFLHDRPVV